MRHLVWTLFVCGLSLSAQAQPADSTRTREVLILNADSLVGGTQNGERVRRLLGNVRLRQDTTLLQADVVIQFQDRDDLSFFGRVRIINDSDTLRADTVDYNRRTRLGVARGNVYLTDGDVQVRAPAGRYEVHAKRASFDQGVTLLDSTSVLTSAAGTYWSDEKRAAFTGDVRLVSEDAVLEADTVTYLRETDVSIARGDVFLQRWAQGRPGTHATSEEEAVSADTVARTVLFGATAYNDEPAGYSRVEGDPLLVQIGEAAPDGARDTLIVQAGRLETTERDSRQRLVAVDSVRIWQRDYAARADSVRSTRWEPPADTLEARVVTDLFQQPTLWVDATQVSGDTIQVSGSEAALDTLYVTGGAFVAQRDSLTGRIRQLAGQRARGLQGADSARTFFVGPAAQAIYFLTDEADRPDGGVRVSGDSIVFRVRGDTPQRVAVLGEPQGTYYAEEQLPDPFRLDGFRWTPEQRPLKAVLLENARIRQRLGMPPPAPASPAIPPPAEPSPPPSDFDGVDARSGASRSSTDSS